MMEKYKVPYYGVIFKNTKTSNITSEYSKTFEKLIKSAALQPGFISIESYDGVTISYWKSLDDIKKWKNDAYHKTIQKKARNSWYKFYNVKIVKVEREYSFYSDS